jgi:hypothetical protein
MAYIYIYMIFQIIFCNNQRTWFKQPIEKRKVLIHPKHINLNCSKWGLGFSSNGFRHFHFTLDIKISSLCEGIGGGIFFFILILSNYITWRLDHNKRSNELALIGYLEQTWQVKVTPIHHLWVYNVHMIIHIVNAKLTPLWRKTLKFTWK